uniref:Ionotropic receptor 75a2 n=1 Tax=Streltzoviella insularis TaxID=1206366 RepID=A0A7D5YXY3_9NEOP|nr:ionotropic receptor 75a2 [Streltzoviella insularis]
MFITKQRIDVLDYLIHPTSGLTVKFVFREPPLSYQNNLYLLPFKLNVWLCIAAFVMILAFILYVNAFWETQKSKSNDKDKLDNTTLKPNVSDIAIFVISAMSQQGSAMELKGTLGRVVTFILFLTFLFLYTSYSASIVALLQSSSKQIRTLSDLLHSKLELGVEDTPYNRYYFSTAKDPVRKAISQKIAPPGSKPNFLNLEDGIKKLQKRPFAFNMNLGTGYKIIERYFHEHEKCGLQEIDFIPDNKPWLGCRKYSPYKEILKIGLYRLQEHGLTMRENRLMYSTKPVCTARGGSFGSVDILDCYPVLLMLLYGMILSFFLLFIEILFHRRQKLLRRIRDIR